METTEPGEMGERSQLLPMTPTLKRALDDLKTASGPNSKQKKEFVKLDKFYHGRQWAPADEARLNDEDRPTAVFNFAQKYIRIVAGSEKSNRQEVVFVARQPEAQLANAQGELSSAIYGSVIDECNGPEERSEAFENLLIRGMGWTNCRLDMEEDPEGKIMLERVDGMKMYWDPAARKQNLEDARWVACEEKVPLKEAQRKWPDKKQELRLAEFLKDDSAGPEGTDVEHATPIQYADVNETPGATLGGSPPTEKGMVRVIEYQYYDVESEYLIEDNAKPDQTSTLDQSQFDKLKRRLSDFDVKFVDRDDGGLRSADPGVIRYAKRDRRVYKRVFLTDQVELETGDLPVQGAGFTYKAMTGTFDPHEKIWRGLLHIMIDPQVGGNKSWSTVMHTINSNSKGGLLAEASAFADPVKAEQDWANPSALILLQDGALSGDKPKIMPRPMTEVSASLFKMFEITVEAIGGVSGINPELLGSTTGDVPGVAQRQRQIQGMTINAGYFSALTRYLRNEARMVLEFIREYVADGRLVTLGGPYNVKAIPLLRQHLPVDYSLVIDEPTKSPNAKEIFWDRMAPLLPMFVKAGMFEPEILDYSPFPASIAAKFKQRIAQREQAAAQNPQQAKGAKDPRETEARIGLITQQAQLTATRAKVLEQEANLKRGQAALGAIGQAQDIGHSGQQQRLERAKAAQELQHGAQRHNVTQLQEVMKLAQPATPEAGV